MKNWPAPVGGNGSFSMKSPAVDLLVWFAPRDDRRMQVVDRMTLDPRAGDCPAQLRYTWEGTPEVGQQLVFTQVYNPHLPFRARASTNNPGAVAVYGDDLQAVPLVFLIEGFCQLQDLPRAVVPGKDEDQRGLAGKVGQVEDGPREVRQGKCRNGISLLDVAEGPPTIAA